MDTILDCGCWISSAFSLTYNEGNIMEKTKEIIMIVLGSIITIGFFATLFYLLYTGNYESTVQLVVGALLTAFGTVVGYYFGSSKSSSDKTKLLSE